MNQLLPYRHKSEINMPLELKTLPNDIQWNGSIIYLDRDGVINKGSEDYINSPDELELLPNISNAIAELKKNGFRVCVVTNQSPINRGLWGHDVLEKIHDKMIKELLKLNNGAVIDLILYSPYAPYEESIARKPNPGMLRAGNILINSAELNISLPDEFQIMDEHTLFNENEMSAIVGDRRVDYMAGIRHGVRAFLVNPNIGLSQVIDRLLDKTDKGDVLH